jgi:hypothetical protein
MRCLACGCSRLDPAGYKCAECGGAPGPRHEQCYVSEETKTTLLAHAKELRRYGNRLRHSLRPIRRISAKLDLLPS